MNKLYALAVIAHPDDESFLLAGTNLKFRAEGKEVGVICATRGEKGTDRLNRKLTEIEMAAIRTKELLHACKILGCECVEFGTYPDGGLERVDFEKLVTEIASKIEKYQPEIILTFGEEGVTGHRDHIVIGKAAIAAAKKSNHKVKEIWLASMPGSAIEKFNEHLSNRKTHHGHYQVQELQGVPDENLLIIDIAKYADQKHEALKAHQSQYLPHFYHDIFQKYEYFEILKP